MNFVSSAVSAITHAERIAIQAGSSVIVPWNIYYNIQDILNQIETVEQNVNNAFDLRYTLMGLYSMLLDDQNNTMIRTAIVFITDTTNSENIEAAQRYSDLIKNMGVRLTAVLMGDQVDQSKLTNITTNFITWSDLTQPQPDNWNDLSGPAYGCETSVSTTAAVSTTSVASTTTAVPYVPCQSYISLCYDVSNALALTDSFRINSFLFNVIESLNHPERIQLQASEVVIVPWNSNYTINDILGQVTQLGQNSTGFNLASVLLTLYQQVISEQNNTVPRASVVFVTDTTTPGSIDGAANYSMIIRNMGVKLTALLIGDKVSQTAVQDLFDEFIVWTNLNNSAPDNWDNLAPGAYGCLGNSSTTPGTITTTAEVPSTTSVSATTGITAR